MALEPTTKTEHNGAKNMGHDKWSHRADLKRASRKRRRRDDRRIVRREEVERCS